MKKKKDCAQKKLEQNTKCATKNNWMFHHVQILLSPQKAFWFGAPELLEFDDLFFVEYFSVDCWMFFSQYNICFSGNYFFASFKGTT